MKLSAVTRERQVKRASFYGVFWLMAFCGFLSAVFVTGIVAVRAAPGDAPLITSITPNSGLTTGGNTVTIAGSFFAENKVEITQVASGQFHTLALDSNGKVYAWGLNGDGQLGTGVPGVIRVPTAVATAGTPMDGKTIVAITAGDYFSLALDSNGQVYAWGMNNFGQLGNNTTAQSPLPIAVVTAGTPMAGKTITAIASGESHSVALDSTGQVYGWGFNGIGQLGNDTNTNSSVPTATVTTGSSLAGKTVISLAAGGNHTMAIDSTHQVHSWGFNGEGQLGTGTTENTRIPNLVAVTGTPMAGKNIVKIAPSVYHSLALDSTGQLYSWGINGNGQLGDGTNSRRLAPVSVATAGTPMAGKTISAIEVGRSYSVVADSTGQVYSWGENNNAQFGNSTTTPSNLPVAVTTAGTPMAGKVIMSVSAGMEHTIVRDNQGKVYGWGRNNEGQLGNDSTAQSQLPVATITTGALQSTPLTLTIGGTAATNITLVNSSTITATAPAHAAGAVDVVVTNGDGQTATLANGYTYGSLPSVPQNLAALHTGTSASVSWTAPANNGGSAITGYSIAYKQPADSTWTFLPAASSPATVTGLISGVSYQFRVAAINSVGTGEYTAVVNGQLLSITVSATAPTIAVVSNRTSSASTTVTVNTNNPSGYVLTMSASTTDRTLKSGGNSITAASGTMASPVALAANTWGYRINGLGGFGSSTTLETNVTTSAFNWAGVPASTSPVIIAQSAAPATNATTNVWYAIRASSTTPSGSYVGTVTYTAVTN